MAIGTHAKRYAFLIHRWTGIGMCILMAIWFVSGIVMLFVGYPKLTPWERLQALPPIEDQACCIEPDAALSHSKAPEDVKEIVLTSIWNRPHYLLREGNGGFTAVNALSGRLAPNVGSEHALASAQAYSRGAASDYIGIVHEDRWTHSRSLNVHRPLHAVQMHDPAWTLLYVSSSTGQVVLDATLAERGWNFAGAWLHWLYMLRNQPVDPVWTWTLIFISAIGVITAFTGVLNGIWRWRFRKTYKNGTHTPFRESYMRWHHLLGLAFGAILFTWMFSGLMSMNPAGIFSAKGQRPDMAAYQGGSPAALRLPLLVSGALSLLKEKGFQPSELEWKTISGKPFILARNGAGDTRLITQSGNGYEVAQGWSDAALIDAARTLMPAPILSHAKLEEYDAYYFKRGTESMYGSNERRLPALRIVYGDPEETWAYLDYHTGQVELSLDRSQRLGRWLFNFLHSWDLPVMLQSGWIREAALILLSLGGMMLSATALLISYRRLRTWIRRLRYFNHVNRVPNGTH